MIGGFRFLGLGLLIKITSQPRIELGLRNLHYTLLHYIYTILC